MSGRDRSRQQRGQTTVSAQEATDVENIRNRGLSPNSRQVFSDGVSRSNEERRSFSRDFSPSTERRSGSGRCEAPGPPISSDAFPRVDSRSCLADPTARRGCEAAERSRSRGGRGLRARARQAPGDGLPRGLREGRRRMGVSVEEPEAVSDRGPVPRPLFDSVLRAGVALGRNSRGARDAREADAEGVILSKAKDL
jgi:hypothetical protein